MTAHMSPEERLKQLKEENERRRRRFEEQERAKREAEELKAKEALERRRLERLAEDQRMRQPWQQPEQPKKPILRAGQKQKPVQVPKRDASPGSDQRRHDAERVRKEWRSGLKAHIEQQRAQQQQQQPAPAEPVSQALTWAELKLAAQEGFEELVRQKEEQQWEAAGLDGHGKAVRHRSPYRGPLKVTAGPEPVPVKLVPGAAVPRPASNTVADCETPVSAATLTTSPSQQPPNFPPPSAADQAHGWAATGVQDRDEGGGEPCVDDHSGPETGTQPPNRRGATTAVRYRPAPSQISDSVEGAVTPALPQTGPSQPSAAGPPVSRPGTVAAAPYEADAHPGSGLDLSAPRVTAQEQASNHVARMAVTHAMALLAQHTTPPSPVASLPTVSTHAAPGNPPTPPQPADVTPRCAPSPSYHDTGSPDMVRMESPTASCQEAACSPCASSQPTSSYLVDGSVSNSPLEVQAATTDTPPTVPAECACNPHTQAEGVSPEVIGGPSGSDRLAPFRLALDMPLDVVQPTQSEVTWVDSPGRNGRRGAVVAVTAALPSSPAARRAGVGPAACAAASPTVPASHTAPLQPQQQPAHLAEQQLEPGQSHMPVNWQPAYAVSVAALSGPQLAAAGDATNPAPASHVQHAPQLPVPISAAVPVHGEGATTTAADEDNFGAVLAEMQHLSLLRKALKAEFEAMGHDQVASGLEGSLTAGFHSEGPVEPVTTPVPVPEPAQPAAAQAAQLPLLTQEPQFNYSLAQPESAGTATAKHSVTQPPEVQLHPVCAAIAQPSMLHWQLPNKAAVRPGPASTLHRPRLPPTCCPEDAPSDSAASFMAHSPSTLSPVGTSGLINSPPARDHHTPVSLQQAEELLMLKEHSNPLFGADSLDNSARMATRYRPQPHSTAPQHLAQAFVAQHPNTQPQGLSPQDHRDVAGSGFAVPNPAPEPVNCSAAAAPQVPVSAPAPQPCEQPPVVPCPSDNNNSSCRIQLPGPEEQQRIGSHALHHSQEVLPQPGTQVHTADLSSVQQSSNLPTVQQPLLQWSMITQHQHVKPPGVSPKQAAPELPSPQQHNLMSGLPPPVVAHQTLYPPDTEPAVSQMAPEPLQWTIPSDQPPRALASPPRRLQSPVRCAQAEQHQLAQAQLQPAATGARCSSSAERQRVRMGPAPTYSQVTSGCPPSPSVLQHQQTLPGPHSVHDACSQQAVYSLPQAPAQGPATLALPSQPQQWQLPVMAPLPQLAWPQQHPQAQPQAQLLTPPAAKHQPPPFNPAHPAVVHPVTAQVSLPSTAAHMPPPTMASTTTATTTAAASMSYAAKLAAPAPAPAPVLNTRAAAQTLAKAIPAAPPVERPLVLEGSYLQAAAETKARLEREQQQRELLSQQRAAATAAAARAAAQQQAEAHARQEQEQQAARHAQPSATKAASNIGSYSQPPPPAHIVNAQRAAQAAAITAAARARAQASTASAPVTAPHTPGAPVQALPLSAPGSPWPDTALPPRSQHLPTAAWVSPGSQAPQSRIPLPPSNSKPSQTHTPPGSGSRELDAVLAGMQDVDGALRELDDYLEHASDDEPSAGGGAPLAGSRKLQDLRPHQLQLPPSGLSTPASGFAPSAAHKAPAIQQRGYAQAQQAPVSNPRAGSAASARPGRTPDSSKAATPFTAAVRQLMGLPGAAPLATAASRSPVAAVAQQPGRLSQEEADLLASLQRIDHAILQRGLARVIPPAAPTPATPPAGAVRKASPSPASRKAAAGAQPARATTKTAAAAQPLDLAASHQALALRESIEKLDVKLAALKAQISGRSAGVYSGPAGRGDRMAAAGSASAVAAGQPRPAEVPSKASKTPTPNKAKALRDARQARFLAAAGAGAPGTAGAGGNNPLASLAGRQASAGARLAGATSHALTDAPPQLPRQVSAPAPPAPQHARALAMPPLPPPPPTVAWGAQHLPQSAAPTLDLTFGPPAVQQSSHPVLTHGPAQAAWGPIPAGPLQLQYSTVFVQQQQGLQAGRVPQQLVPSGYATGWGGIASVIPGENNSASLYSWSGAPQPQLQPQQLPHVGPSTGHGMWDHAAFPVHAPVTVVQYPQQLSPHMQQHGHDVQAWPQGSGSAGALQWPATHQHGDGSGVHYHSSVMRSRTPSYTGNSAWLAAPHAQPAAPWATSRCSQGSSGQVQTPAPTRHAGPTHVVADTGASEYVAPQVLKGKQLSSRDSHGQAEGGVIRAGHRMDLLFS